MLHKIEVKNFKEEIKRGFATDEALLSSFHVYAGKGLDACVEKTCSDLMDDTHHSFRFYNVYKSDELVGFFGEEDVDGTRVINTVFVYPQHRNKNVMFDFVELLAPPFITGLYAKNIPAINFYKKNGGKIIKEFKHDGHNAVILVVGEL